MIPRKNGVAEQLGIKFTGNPDVKDHCEKEKDKEKKKPNPVDHPGACLIESLT